MSLAQRSAMADETERLRARVVELEAEVARLRAERPSPFGIPEQRDAREHSRQGWGN